MDCVILYNAAYARKMACFRSDYTTAIDAANDRLSGLSKIFAEQQINGSPDIDDAIIDKTYSLPRDWLMDNENEFADTAFRACYDGDDGILAAVGPSKAPPIAPPKAPTVAPSIAPSKAPTVDQCAVPPYGGTEGDYLAFKKAYEPLFGNGDGADKFLAAICRSIKLPATGPRSTNSIP